MSCFAIPPAGAAELGALARRFIWPGTTNNFATYTKGGTGIVSDTRAVEGLSSHASASFHSLAGACRATGGTNPSTSNQPFVGGLAYWFDQITITSPSVPNGTQGVLDFTLFFEGKLSAGLPNSELPGMYSAAIEYSWAGIGLSSGGNGQPDTGVGGRYTRKIDVFSSYAETLWPDFLYQPRQHQMFFIYGEPFDFTVTVGATGSVYFRAPSSVNAQIRLTGWNGFRNIRAFDTPVTDAVIDSQTGFNWGGAGTMSFEQWASQFQLAADSMNWDANQNGVSNLLEYALGRDPMEPGGGEPIVLGKAMEEGVEYPTIVFTRPVQGAMPGDIEYLPERNTTLEPDGWSGNGLVVETEPVAGTQLETVTVRSPEPLGLLDGEWMRLKVVKGE